MNVSEMTIQEVKEYLSSKQPLDEKNLLVFKRDQRKGVQLLVEQFQRRADAEWKRKEQWEKMTRIENTYDKRGYYYIAGIDEAGRGPLAGPVVAGAVILDRAFYLPGLNDSKQVSPPMREVYYEEIMEKALAVGVGIGSVELIDRINIYQATLHAMKEAVGNLSLSPDILLNDAVTIPDVNQEQIPIIGGDSKSVSIAAASIVAKVTRDRLMVEWGKQFPGYGFEKDMGYGTRDHIEALKKQGICEIHRKSFGIVKDYVG